MYLYRKTYVKNWEHTRENELHQITVKLNKKKHPYINIENITYITETVGEWRKANAIHKWFVESCQDGVDDCGVYEVTIESLYELLSVCKNVLENPKSAKSELPTQSGFFFGNIEYDKYYFDEIKRTIKIIEPLIEDYEKMEKNAQKENGVYLDASFGYRSSW